VEPAEGLAGNQNKTNKTGKQKNEFGLVEDLDHATKIAKTIRETNSEEPHCKDCRVWGIARLEQ